MLTSLIKARLFCPACLQAGAYEDTITIKLISSLKRHLSRDSSRDCPLLRGVSAAESKRPSSGGGYFDGVIPFF
jgi:hypothetical protein